MITDAILRSINIATNGRWAIAGLLAIALHANLYGFALAWVLVLIASHLIEQLDAKFRVAGYLAIVAWMILVGLAFVVVLLWR